MENFSIGGGIIFLDSWAISHTAV